VFLDSRTLPATERIDADICIIGGGAAGIAMAREFIGGPHRVCVLESGGRRIDRRTQALCDAEYAGLAYDLDTTRTRFFGGSTNCWGGFCRPFADFHFQRRDWVPDSGWPIGRRELDPYYRRAHALCGLDPEGYDPEVALPAIAGHGLRPMPLGGGRLVSLLAQLVKERRRFGESFHDELARADNVVVYLHANVVELCPEPGSNRVERAEVRTLQGNGFAVSAQHFVLATGAVENARLLLLSRSAEDCGLGNRNDLVGRYFMEHPRPAVLEGRITEAWTGPINAYNDRFCMLRLPLCAEVGINPEIQQREQLLDSCAHVEYVIRGEECAATFAAKRFYYYKGRGYLPPRPLRDLATLMSAPFSVGLFALGLYTSWKRLVTAQRIRLVCEQAPNRDSRVMLSDARDELGLNKVRLDWRMSALDAHSLQRSTEIYAEELAAAGVLTAARVLPPTDLDAEPDPTSPPWTWHHMGTTRMDPDPKRGVVDADCRVHGMGNLWIASCSVFPTTGNHTPTFTMLAMALRLADRLDAALSQPGIPELRDRQAERPPRAGAGLPEAVAVRSGLRVTETGRTVGLPNPEAG